MPNGFQETTVKRPTSEPQTFQHRIFEILESFRGIRISDNFYDEKQIHQQLEKVLNLGLEERPYVDFGSAWRNVRGCQVVVEGGALASKALNRKPRIPGLENVGLGHCRNLR